MEELETREIRLDFFEKNVNVISRTGERASFFITEKYLRLNPDLIYEIPVNDKSCLDDYYYFKADGRVCERVVILNVRDGYIVIKPLIVTVLKDGDVMGRLI